MSHKSGHIIINAMLPEGGAPLPTLTPQQQNTLNDIRQRDEYNMADRLTLGYIIGLIADDPAD